MIFSDFIVVLFAEYAHYFVLVTASLVLLIDSSRDQRMRFVKITLLSGILALSVDKLLNQVISSPRPFVADGIVPLFLHVEDNGFPSEHTLLVVVVASLVYLQNKKIGLILILVAITIGIARVLAGVHHMIDVIGAVLIGVCAVVIGRWVVARYSVSSLSE